MSLEGNFLAAYVAGSARDTAAATTFFREAIQADPRNQELLERAFVAFLANGSMPEAFRAAERLSARDATNNLAQFALERPRPQGAAIRRRPRPPRQGRPRPPGGPDRDAAHRLGLCGLQGRQAGARDRRQAEERARLQPVPRIPRGPDRRRDRQSGRGREALQGGLRGRAQHPAGGRRLCPLPGQARPQGRGAGGLQELRRCAAAPSGGARRHGGAQGRQAAACRSSATPRTAPPKCSTASASSATPRATS